MVGRTHQTHHAIALNAMFYILIPVACADAYLTPCIKSYVSGFTSGFQKGIEVRHDHL